MLKWVNKTQTVVDNDQLWNIYQELESLSWHVTQLEDEVEKLKEELKSKSEMDNLINDSISGGISGLKELLQYNENVALYGYDAVYGKKEKE